MPEVLAMYSHELVVNTLRTIKNKFWANLLRVDQCVGRGWVRMTPSGPELTEQEAIVLKEAEATSTL